jgi:AraC-like DNA-binding protein
VITPVGHPEAVLRPAAAERALTVERLPPSPDLAWALDYHWLVRWSVEGTHEQRVLPQPRVHLAVEDGRVWVHGVNRAPFVRRLTGTGHALGASFLPGAFRVVLGRSVREVTGRVLPAGDLLGRNDAAVAAAVAGTDDAAAMVAALEGWLRALVPRPDPVAAEVAVEVAALVERARTDRSLTRVEQLAGVAGRSVRSLERLFGEYVGIGPKWVVQSYRVLDTAAAAHGGEPVDWAALAADLGFTDQAHLTRVFREVVGAPPATYRRDAVPQAVPGRRRARSRLPMRTPTA